MLAAHEFFVGPLGSASGMTLVLRRHEREASFLVTATAEIPTAIFLDGEFRFTCMPSVNNTSWNGIVVPNINIEVDETSILHPDRGEPLGTVVRKQTQLFIMAKHQPHGRATLIGIVAMLPPCHENQSAAFGRWQIVLGEGPSKRILFKVELMEK